MLSKKVKNDIKIVLDYLWKDEERHCFESGNPKEHIFMILKRLAKVVKYEARFR